MKRQEDRKILEAKSKKKKKDYDKEMQESVSIMLVKLFFRHKNIFHTCLGAVTQSTLLST